VTVLLKTSEATVSTFSSGVCLPLLLFPQENNSAAGSKRSSREKMKVLIQQK
jgi:hypothetical protein